MVQPEPIHAQSGVNEWQQSKNDINTNKWRSERSDPTNLLIQFAKCYCTFLARPCYYLKLMIHHLHIVAAMLELPSSYCSLELIASYFTIPFLGLQVPWPRNLPVQSPLALQ